MVCRATLTNWALPSPDGLGLQLLVRSSAVVGDLRLGLRRWPPSSDGHSRKRGEGESDIVRTDSEPTGAGSTAATAITTGGEVQVAVRRKEILWVMTGRGESGSFVFRSGCGWWLLGTYASATLGRPTDAEAFVSMCFNPPIVHASVVLDPPFGWRGARHGRIGWGRSDDVVLARCGKLRWERLGRRRARSSERGCAAQE